MSYVVIARRWRPQQFDEVIGQEHVTQTLANAIAGNRIAHSYIFSGPRGVGKTTTARILAKAVNCKKGPTPTPCNECPSCKAITLGNSMDVLEIDGASNRGIDEIRNLRENIRYMPTQGKYRIYIIDEVHMLTKEAFNALLKTLEEPPEHAMFIFATTEIHRVPATILSRCQRFDFRRIPVKTIMTHLSHICKEDSISIEEEALLQIAKKADGSMRDAESILDQIISYSGTKITFEDITRALGVIHQDLFFQLTELIQKNDLPALISMARDIFDTGYDLNEFLLGLEEHFRNLLVTRATAHTDFLDVSESFMQKYADVARTFSENDLIGYLQIIQEIGQQMKNSQQPNLKFELGLIKMAKLPATAEIETILEKLELLKKKALKSKIEDSAATSPQTEHAKNPGQISAQEISRYWDGLLSKLSKSKPTLSAVLKKSKIVGVEGHLVHIEFTEVNEFEEKRIQDQKHFLQKEFQTISGMEYRLKIKMNVIKQMKTKPAKKRSVESKEKVVSEIRAKGGDVISKAIDELDLGLI